MKYFNKITGIVLCTLLLSGLTSCQDMLDTDAKEVVDAVGGKEKLYLSE